MMDVCGEALGKVATELMNYEVQLERDILDPLNQLAEVQTHADANVYIKSLTKACYPTVAFGTFLGCTILLSCNSSCTHPVTLPLYLAGWNSQYTKAKKATR